jgi:hypothetical protein
MDFSPIQKRFLRREIARAINLVRSTGETIRIIYVKNNGQLLFFLHGDQPEELLEETFNVSGEQIGLVGHICPDFELLRITFRPTHRKGGEKCTFQ